MRDDDENDDDDDDDDDDEDDDDEWQQGRERLLNPSLKIFEEGGKGIIAKNLLLPGSLSSKPLSGFMPVQLAPQSCVVFDLRIFSPS